MNWLNFDLDQLDGMEKVVRIKKKKDAATAVPKEKPTKSSKKRAKPTE